jgi:hypothetical protein
MAKIWQTTARWFVNAIPDSGHIAANSPAARENNS